MQEKEIKKVIEKVVEESKKDSFLTISDLDNYLYKLTKNNKTVEKCWNELENNKKYNHIFKTIC